MIIKCTEGLLFPLASMRTYEIFSIQTLDCLNWTDKINAQGSFVCLGFMVGFLPQVVCPKLGREMMFESVFKDCLKKDVRV